MWYSLSVVATILSSVSAQGYYNYGSEGPLLPGAVSTTEGQQFEIMAGRSPNATKAMNFTRSYNGSSEQWTWRVNVTEYAVPDQLSQLGVSGANFSMGYHVTNTQWQLQWPGDQDTLQSFLASRNMTMSASVWIVPNATGLVEGYADAMDGNCTAILGTQCTSDLTQAVNQVAPAVSRFAFPHSCFGPLTDSVINAEGDGVGFEVSPTTNTTNATLYRNGTFFYSASGTFTSNTTGMLAVAESAVQLLIMDFESTVPNLSEPAQTPSIVCQIVRANSNSSNSSTGGSGSSGSTGKSTAPVWTSSISAVFGVVLLGSLLVLW